MEDHIWRLILHHPPHPQLSRYVVNATVEITNDPLADVWLDIGDVMRTISVLNVRITRGMSAYTCDFT